jgi:hypothetical protein
LSFGSSRIDHLYARRRTQGRHPLPFLTESIALGTDFGPPNAKIYRNVVDTLPSFMLKNEKDKDAHVKALTDDEDLVLLLVPKADIRMLLSLTHSIRC